MFSCGGRGPSANMVPEEMMDSTHFDKAFPGLPLAGFYAGELARIIILCLFAKSRNHTT